MESPRFKVKINLKLEAITCPGVWLCSHGYLEVSIKSLGYFFRTGALEPYFPLLCHEQFKMEGHFKNAQSIANLLNNLSREQLEITLWQSGRRLAYYQGVIMDLLQFSEPKLQCPHSNTQQLLMKSTPAFPGIIAPKVEITSHFYIKDKLLNLSNNEEDLKTCKNLLRNPQTTEKFVKILKPSRYQRPCTVQSYNSEDFSANHMRKPKQRPVCHTREFKELIRKSPNESVYTKSRGRRVSIASSYASNNTDTSMGICDLESDNLLDKFGNHGSDQEHEKYCELCRLYKEVFLQ
ncbi:uncharacterized protein ACRADG_002791 [Cochliomyia hominivorax]